MTITIDSIASVRVVDLTLTLDERLKEEVVPWVPGITFTPTVTIEENGNSVHRVITATHCGTHVDAQTHFIKDGVTIRQCTLQPVDR